MEIFSFFYRLSNNLTNQKGIEQLSTKRLLCPYVFLQIRPRGDDKRLRTTAANRKDTNTNSQRPIDRPVPFY